MSRNVLVMSRVLAVIVIVVVAIFTLSHTVFSPHAHAAPAPSSSSDFYSLETTCAEIDVQLHGTQSPTTTCAQAKASGTIPLTETRPCSVSGVTMKIYYNSYSRVVCFIATGYWAYRVNNVSEVVSPTQKNGWFRFYYRGSTFGEYCNLDSNNLWDSYHFASYGTSDITQIYPGAINSGGADVC